MLDQTERTLFEGTAEDRFHPELRRIAGFLPRFSFGPATTWLVEMVRKRRALSPPPVLEDVAIRDHHIARPGDEPLRIRVYTPAGAADDGRPALLWIHGGGFIMGHPEHDEAQSIEFCRKLGIVVASVNYRFGREHPFPRPLEDCYDALAWLHANAGTLGLAPRRIAIGGASAGGGLAAGLALLAHDRGELPVAFQLLVYPMIDDRTARRGDVEGRRLRIWSARSNATGWRIYLAGDPGGEGVSAYAAPARRIDLAGLPPAWVGVGTCDLFLDEDIAYAARLNAAGVACALKIVPGAFHAFDLVAPGTQVAAEFRHSYFEALRLQLCDSHRLT